MIDFGSIRIGDRVRVIGMGAPGFARLGEELEITRVEARSVCAKRDDGLEAFFALTCGASRLELVQPAATPEETP